MNILIVGVIAIVLSIILVERDVRVVASRLEEIQNEMTAIRRELQSSSSFTRVVQQLADIETAIKRSN
jgi:hypothetical protein